LTLAHRAAAATEVFRPFCRHTVCPVAIIPNKNINIGIEDQSEFDRGGAPSVANNGAPRRQ